MKIKIWIIISLMVIFLTTGCSKVNSAKITINNEGTHSNKDIDKVISKLKNEFKYYFNDCEMLSIDYDSDKQGIKEWNNTKYYDILTIDFDFIAKKNTQVLSKDNTYGYTAYYGKKSENSSWQRIDWGQG